MEFHFKKSAGLALHQALSLEWLETNGLGGYASSSILNCHTRKYHGLLVSKLDNLPDKYVLLSKVEDMFAFNGDEYFLSAHAYPNYLQDGSFSCFKEYEQDTHPRFLYQFDDLTVTKELLLLNEENTLLFKYFVFNNGNNSRVTIRPFLAFRNFNALAKENKDLKTQTSVCKNGITITPYPGLPTLFLQADSAFEFQAEPLWYNNFEYEQERVRGYNFQEDLFSPGIFTFKQKGNSKLQELIFSCSVVEQKDNLKEKFNHELENRKSIATKLIGSPLQKQLQKVGLSFIEKIPRKNATAIVAGYHWFLEWGRDAMISLPGLTLYSGLEDVCLAVLKSFAAQEKNGLIPNFLGEKPEQNAYNSVDASLWFVWAVQQYYAKTKDSKGIAQYLWKTLKSIYNNYKKGTLYNIKVQENGLVYAGSKELNLSWMDAVVNNVPVTPRYGYMVEVNALWYNMLCFMTSMADALLDPIKHEIEPMIKKTEKAFAETFWNADVGYLYDFVNEEEKNAAIRPNQIFAVSLPNAVVTHTIATKVVCSVKQHLYTPYGLRTLSPHDKNYVGYYNGDGEERDRAYHNGVVWPWLLAPFGEAMLKTVADRRKVIRYLKPAFAALTANLSEAGIGSISEIFSGDEYHQANGCISQAWSVAEVLRLSYLLNID